MDSEAGVSAAIKAARGSMKLLPESGSCSAREVPCCLLAGGSLEEEDAGKTAARLPRSIAEFEGEFCGIPPYLIADCQQLVSCEAVVWESRRSPHRHHVSVPEVAS